MSKSIRGKFLMRRGTLANGEEVLILAGVARPTDFQTGDLDDNDEMWVADVTFEVGLRFSGRAHNNLPMEDFLEGEQQSPKCWAKKEQLL